MRVTAPVSAAHRFSPACLSRNLAMTRWMMRSTCVSYTAIRLQSYGSSSEVLKGHATEKRQLQTRATSIPNTALSRR